MSEPDATVAAEPGPDGARETRRIEVAGALRELLHAFVGHELDDEALEALDQWARRTVTDLHTRPPRDRVSLMRLVRSRAPFEVMPDRRAGFEDRAVGGRADPTSVPFDARREGDAMVADIVLDAAFEGAPGRAHGGIVAAVFDDFTGLVIGMLQQPAFTGELTVRFVRPVPVHRPLRFRTWLDRRDGRKLHIQADAHDGDVLVATCRAIYIAVDPSVFDRAPDPR